MSDTPIPFPLTGEERLTLFNRMVDEGRYQKFRIEGKPFMLDLWSASCIVQVANALNKANRVKFLNMDLIPMAVLAMDLLVKNRG